MINEAPRICAAIGCGRVLVRRPNEANNDWYGRICCDRLCANRYGNQCRHKIATAKQLERVCRYCLTPLVRRADERLTAFRRREGCGQPSCVSMKHRNRALARWAGKKLSAVQREPSSGSSPVIGPGLSPEEAVARFIAEHGITRCPTAAVIATTGEIAKEDQAAVQLHHEEQDKRRRERNPARWGNYGV